MSENFPPLIHPTGWFQIAWSDDLGPCEVRPLRYFDTDLVLYRAENGEAHLLDGHCAHLGAHLGHGGSVRADCIVCPFHGWTWDSGGHNVEIPYSKRPNQRKKVRAWELREANGMLLAWHDAAGAPPSWEPPALPEYDNDDYFEAATYGWYGRQMQPWMLTENLVDCAHSQYVHRTVEPTKLKSVAATDGEPYAHILMDFPYGKRRTDLTPQGTVWGELEIGAWGVGLVSNRFAEGYYDALQFITVTPIDLKTSDFRVSIWVAREYGDGDEQPSGKAQAIIDEQIKVLEPDLRIWENMIYVAHPPLAPEEHESYLAMRRWIETFYPSESRAAVSA
jgi:3-ketosteroid 9alpha-monooxygenase subunit A